MNKFNKYMILCLAFTMSCTTLNYELFQIGSKFDYIKDIDILDTVILFDSQFKMKKCILIEYKSIKYNLNLNEDEKLNMVITKDDNFITPEGFSIGETFNEIKKKSMYINSYYENKTYRLNSGWDAIFFSNEPINDSSQIKWFEKRTN